LFKDIDGEGLIEDVTKAEVTQKEREKDKKRRREKREEED